MNAGAPTQRVMAFDFGLASIGVAVGNAHTGTATPAGAASARNGRPDWSRLDALVREWQPDLLVVGAPLNMDGSDSEMAGNARRFLRRLQARYHLPCQMTDERLTTFEARMTPGAGPRNKPELDAAAACVILESWFRAVAEGAPGGSGMPDSLPDRRDPDG